MTMCHERTRSLIWMGEVLEELRQSDKVPADFKQKLELVLRDYPSRAEIERHAMQTRLEQLDPADPWLLPSIEDKS